MYKYKVKEQEYAVFTSACQAANKYGCAVEKSDRNGAYVVYHAHDSDCLKRYSREPEEVWNNMEEFFHQKPDSERQFYFDMDGVLARWYPDFRGYDLEDILTGGCHYFRDLEPQPKAIELAKALVEAEEDVYILSAAAKDTIRDKWFWVKDHLPFIKEENILFCPLGADKSKFVPSVETGVLFDDYNLNLYSWGGKAVKIINDINSRNDDFPCIYVYNDTPVEEEIERIKEIAAYGRSIKEMCDVLSRNSLTARFVTIPKGKNYFAPEEGVSNEQITKVYNGLMAIIDVKNELAASYSFEEE